MNMLSRDRVYSQLTELALNDFGDIVDSVKNIEGKLRFLLSDGSYVDIWLSVKKKGTYAYHWERREIDGTIYRYNNLPDKNAKKLKTYPNHFHDKKEKNVVESYMSDNPVEAVKSLLNFVRKMIK